MSARLFLFTVYHEILKCNDIQIERIGCSFDRTTGTLQ